MSYILELSELRQVFTGAKVLACGGGGESEWAEPLLQAMDEANLQVRIAEHDELRDRDWLCVPGGMGAGSSPEIRESLRTIPKIAPDTELLPEMARRCLTTFESMAEREFDRFLAVNPGPVLWGLPMYLAALRDRPVLDGDCAGRAIPQWTTTTLNVKDLRLAPAAFVSAYGDQVTFHSTHSNERLEAIGRPVAVACGGWGVFITGTFRGEQIRDAYVPGVIRRARAIGAALTEARQEGTSPVGPCVEAAEGTPLFRGTVSAYERREQEGFMLGEIRVEGTGEHLGQECRVYQKSEYSIAWVDGEVIATCPDSICIIDAHTGEGLTSFPDFAMGPFPPVREADFALGREIVIFGIDAHPIWTTERGILLYGPQSLGFDIEYRPVTERVEIG